MATAKTAHRSNNINIRVTPDTLGLIDRAAHVFGKTRTDFILDTVRKVAEEAILDQRVFILNPDKWQEFTDALDAPLQPNPQLDALLARKPAWEND
jgi:uncharacterized protein (DUF1778 family)